ncbi:hypothetical protein D3C75_319030 [compost metagenome]
MVVQLVCSGRSRFKEQDIAFLDLRNAFRRAKQSLSREDDEHFLGIAVKMVRVREYARLQPANIKIETGGLDGLP